MKPADSGGRRPCSRHSHLTADRHGEDYSDHAAGVIPTRDEPTAWQRITQARHALDRWVCSITDSLSHSVVVAVTPAVGAGPRLGCGSLGVALGLLAGILKPPAVTAARGPVGEEDLVGDGHAQRLGRGPQQPGPRPRTASRGTSAVRPDSRSNSSRAGMYSPKGARCTVS
jgi:hypothetical protein